MASGDRFKKIAEDLGEQVTDLLVEEDVYIDNVLFALEDLNLSRGENFLQVTPEQLREKYLSKELIEGFEIAQRRYKDIYLNTDEKGSKATSYIHPDSTECSDLSSYPSEVQNKNLVDSLKASPILRKGGKEKENHLYLNNADTREGLIIINEKFTELNERKVAKKEEKALLETADLLKIHIEESNICHDLTAKDMGEKISDFAKSDNTLKASLIFIAIISHGGKGDKISGVDNATDFLFMSKVEQILDKYQKLIAIPKIFLIQTCFGGENVSANVADNVPYEVKDEGNATTTSDTVIVFTSGKDDIVCCSDEFIFFDELNKCLRENKSCHFIEHLTICSRKIADKYTEKEMMCTFQSTLQKFLSFDM